MHKRQQTTATTTTEPHIDKTITSNGNSGIIETNTI